MKRIDGAGHVNNRFVAEDTQTGRPPTELTAEWHNNVQEEICAVIEAAGGEVNGVSQHQLKDAINTLIESVPIANVMTGATASLNGTAGLVPAPCASDENKFLAGNGTFKYVSGVPVGTIEYFAMSTPPQGYLKADGTAVGRETYPELFGAIGIIYGAGDSSTTFNLPDLRGEFIRGFDNGRNVDTGRVFGSAQGDAIRNITGEFQSNGIKGIAEVTTSGALSTVATTKLLNLNDTGGTGGQELFLTHHSPSQLPLKTAPATSPYSPASKLLMRQAILD